MGVAVRFGSDDDAVECCRKEVKWGLRVEQVVVV